MRTEADIVERLRHTAGHLINGAIEDGAVCTGMLCDAASDIEDMRADIVEYKRENEQLRAERDAAVCCDGCGSMLTDAQIIAMRKSDPKIISCCPERKPLTIKQWRKRAHDFEAAARDIRERAAHAGYVACAKTRHVTLGNAVSAAIMALPTTPTVIATSGKDAT